MIIEIKERMSIQTLKKLIFKTHGINYTTAMISLWTIRYGLQCERIGLDKRKMVEILPQTFTTNKKGPPFTKEKKEKTKKIKA